MNMDSNQNNLEQSFEAAALAVKNSCKSKDAWDHLEEFAQVQGYEEKVGKFYKSMIGSNLSPGEFDFVARRAVYFFDEWLGDEKGEIQSLLESIIAINDKASWAFNKLTELLSAASKWEALFEVYDRVLERSTDIKRKIELLEEAAGIARDMADLPDKALEYLLSLQRLDKNSSRLRIIERMLEKRHRWSELIDLWNEQLPRLSPDEAMETRLNVASCYLEKLKQAKPAIEQLVLILQEHPANEKASVLLESILKAEEEEKSIRMKALEILQNTYQVSNNYSKAVEVLDLALEFSEHSEKAFLLRKAGALYALLEKDELAIARYGTLLAIEPGDADALRQLRALSMRSRRFDLRAQALISAASTSADDAIAVDHLCEAAEIYVRYLNNPQGAIDVYTRLLSMEIDNTIALKIAYSLNDQLATAGEDDKRIDVLEKIARLEPTSMVRRTILQEAAKLAASLELPHRALEFWGAVLEENSTDLEALSAVIALMQGAGQWDKVVTFLETRACAKVLSQQRRSDLVQAASIKSSYLKDIDGAIDSWKKILDEFGVQEDVLDNLDELMSSKGQYEQLLKIYKLSQSDKYNRLSQMYSRMGEIALNELEDAKEAVLYFEKVLVLNPEDEKALEAVNSLVENEEVSFDALKILVKIYSAKANWEKLVSLADNRILVAQTELEKISILSEAAYLCQNELGDYEEALKRYCESILINPKDSEAEKQIMKLAEQLNDWNSAALVFEKASAMLLEGSALWVRFLKNAALIYEIKLEDSTKALKLYLDLEAAQTDSSEITDSVIRLCALTGAFDRAINTLIMECKKTGVVSSDILSILEEEATKQDLWEILLLAIEKSLEEHPEISVWTRVDLELRLSSWYKQHLQDLKGALRAAKRAVLSSPDNIEVRKKLASYQKESPNIEYIDNLIEIYRLSRNDLDPLFEAGKIALSVIDDYEQHRKVLVLQYEESSRYIMSGVNVAGHINPQTSAQEAVSKIVDLDLENGQNQKAAMLLINAAKLPFGQEKIRQMLRKAASILASLEMVPMAIEVYNQVLSFRKDDVETLEDVDYLLEQENRVLDLLSVKRQRLELVYEQDIKTQLRLEISKLSGILEGDDARLQMLKKNLEEKPGEPQSLKAIAQVFEQRAMYKEMILFFKEQAEKMLTLGDEKISASLFEKAARTAMKKSDDLKLTISLYTELEKLEPGALVYDALAGLYQKTGNSEEGIAWLYKRLEVAEQAEKVSIMIRLARVLLSVGRNDEAIFTLEQAFEQAPQNAEVRKLLFERLREAKLYEKLGNALKRAIGYVKDERTQLYYANEAADVLFYKLNDKAGSVEVLQKVVELDSQNNEARIMLAESLLSAEKFEEARELFEAILEGYGRRRSPQRAKIHARLAEVIKAQGDIDGALEHLEQALKMDTHNVEIAVSVATLAHEKGDIDLAERTWRTLLMTVRREQSASDIIGPAHILVQLSFIYREKEQLDKMSQFQESALEELINNDKQGDSLTQLLLEKQEYELLCRVYQTRLNYLEKPVKRGRILHSFANLLEEYLDNLEGAFEKALAAVNEDPGSPVLHDSAMSLAQKVGKADEYKAILIELIDKKRRVMDALTRCELLLRLISIKIEQGEDLNEARKLFAQAESLGVREVDVIRTGARLAGALGDQDEQVRLLTLLSGMGASDSESDAHVDAMFRLAEIYLFDEETFEEGLAQLSAAYEESSNHDRCGRILRRVAKKESTSSELISLFEKVARKADDKELLLDYFVFLSRFVTSTPAQILEGALLAEEMEQNKKAEGLFEKAVAAYANHPEFSDSVLLSMINLSIFTKGDGDFAGAVKWFMDAADLEVNDKVFELGIDLGNELTEVSKDLMLAAKVFERLNEINPGIRKVWEPLSEIYLKLENFEGFECLVEETMYSIEQPDERNDLRLKWARLLFAQKERESDAVDVLKNILLDDPGHANALSLLTEYYVDTDRTEEMIELLQERFDSAYNRKNELEVKNIAIELGRHLKEKSQKGELYRKALCIAVDDRDLILLLIETLDPQEDAVERIELLERTLATSAEESSVSLVMEVAKSYAEMGDEEGKTRTLKDAFMRDPSCKEVREALEADYRKKQDYKGLVLLLKAAAENEGTPRQLLLYGEIADTCKDYLEDVKGEIEALSMMEPAMGNNAEFVIRMVDALKRDGRNGEALERAGAALEVLPEDKKYELLILSSCLKRDLGDFQGVLADLEKAYVINSEEIGPILEKNLVDMISEGGEYELLKPAMTRLISLYEKQKKFEELRSTLILWLQIHNDDVESWMQFCEIEQNSQNWPGVIEACKKLTVLTEGTQQIEIGMILTHACKQSGEMEIARRGLEYIYKTNVDGISLREELKKVYEEVGAWHELATFLAHDAKAIEDLQDSAELFLKAGDAYLKAGDAKTALLALNEALERVPDSMDATILVVDIQMESGDFEAALERVEQAIDACVKKRSPEMAALQYRRAKIAGALNDRAEQLSWLEQAASSDRTNAEIMAELADLAQELEEWDVALKALRNISLMKGDCPISKAESFYRQGCISMNQGEDKKAVLYVKKALQEDRDHLEAMEWLEKYGG